jgi:DNA-directed RNA polymerase specialized sigma24 family protein
VPLSEQAGFAPILLDDTFQEDLEWVYQETAVAVYRRIFARVGNAPDAEDLTEEVFLTAHRWLRLPCARGPGACLSRGNHTLSSC